MINDVTKSFRAREGFSFDNEVYILAGDEDQNGPEMPQVPDGSIYLKYGAEPGIFQSIGQAWVAVGSDKDRIDDLTDIVANLLSQYDIDKADILDEIATSNEEITTNATEISNLEGATTTNAANISTNASGITTNATNIASNDIDITNLQNRVTATETDIAAAEEDLTTAEDRIGALEAEMVANASADTLLTNRVTAVEGASASNTTDIAAVQTTAASIQGRVTATEADVASINTAITTKAEIAYVDTRVQEIINGAPAELDTLNELSIALQNDSDAIVAINATLATKAPLTVTDGHNTRITTLENAPGFDPSSLQADIAANTSAIAGIVIPDVTNKADKAYVDSQDTTLQTRINDLTASDIAQSIEGFGPDVNAVQNSMIGEYRAFNTSRIADIAGHETRITDLEADSSAAGEDKMWQWHVGGFSDEEKCKSLKVSTIRNIEEEESYWFIVRGMMMMEFRGIAGKLYTHNSSGNLCKVFGYDTANRNMDEDFPAVFSLLPGSYRIYPSRDGTLSAILYSWGGHPLQQTDSDWSGHQVRDHGLWKWCGGGDDDEDAWQNASESQGSI